MPEGRRKGGAPGRGKPDAPRIRSTRPRMKAAAPRGPDQHVPTEAERGRSGRVSRQAPETGATSGDRDGCRLFDGYVHHAAPFGPRAVIVPYPVVAEQLVQHEPGVGRAFTDTAIGHDILVGRHAFRLVERP